MVAAQLVSIAAIAASLFVSHGAPEALPARLAAACRADVFVIVFLFAAIANVARLRFFSESDIDGSGMTEATNSLRIANAILQNRLEQSVLASDRSRVHSRAVAPPDGAPDGAGLALRNWPNLFLARLSKGGGWSGVRLRLDLLSVCVGPPPCNHRRRHWLGASSLGI